MIEQLLAPGVVAVEAFADVLGELVFPGEEDLIANAVGFIYGIKSLLQSHSPYTH
jgi:hypothetical protein